MKLRAISLAPAVFAMLVSAAVGQTTRSSEATVRDAVDRAIQPLMAKDGIPGMAVGVVAGESSYIFDYGVASVEPRRPVTRDTLFELGSISKTFTATLTSWAQVNGELSLQDKTSRFLPELKGTAFGNVALMNLGTHTPGGLPLQVPDNIHNNHELMGYLRAWRPEYAPGSYRTYTNIGIGTLGLITAKSMGQAYASLVQGRLFPALGMKSSFILVPADKMADYAEGYTGDGKPIRMAQGVLWEEAYGIRTTAGDMIRFLAVNMHLAKVDTKLERAVANTHTGYYQAGPMTQDLIWEQYPYPVTLTALQQGNSPEMILNATPVTAIEPPEMPRADVWINKTGSTNGFGEYVAFIPEKRLGIVILANKNYPIADRVTAAYEILTALAGHS